MHPAHSSGCNDGDGFTDFAPGGNRKLRIGLDDNMGYDGWSQYLNGVLHF
ncbi:MAG: hypothetical protein R2764_05645 [Bacteroidales bacterium]